MGYKVRHGLQSATSVTGIAKCKRITKGNSTKPPIYIHCLTVQSIISTFKVLYEKSFFNGCCHSQRTHNSRHYSRHFHVYILDKCSTKFFKICPSRIHNNTIFSCFWLSGEYRVLKRHFIGVFPAEVSVIILHWGSGKFTENLLNLGY